MNHETAISVEDASKVYYLFESPTERLISTLLKNNPRGRKEVHALAHVNLVVKKGETLAIIGRNGSGKSTLLQIICGILKPTHGRIHTHGRIAALLELGAGFNPEFTGRENVYLSAAIYGLTRDKIDARLNAILDFSEIGEYIDQPVKTYSSGMFVRLAFSIIAHLEADILVIDEALAVGDIYFTQKCMRFLREFKKHGTLLFVSHDTSSVINLCDRAAWLEKGRLLMEGDARKVSEAYIASFYEANGSSSPETPSHTLPEEKSGSSSSGEFGAGGAKILKTRLVDVEGKDLHVLDHAQMVTLMVECVANEAIESPILGFFVRDRLGQPLFGENSLGRSEQWSIMNPGQHLTLSFSFHMPLLATGDYTLGVALGAGDQLKHVQHHWIYDALAFKSQCNPHLTGIIELTETSFDVSPTEQRPA